MQQALAMDDRPRLWVPGDWNGFFGLFTNVLLNVIVLTGLSLGVVKMPEDIVYGRILPALGIALPLGNLYYAFLAWRLAKGRGTRHCHGDALRPERAAHVHRRVPDHAADLSADQRSDPGLAGGIGLGVHHRGDCAAGRVRWSDYSQIHAASCNAWHACGDLDRVHLDAAQLSNVGGPLDRVRGVRDHPDQLDGERAPAVWRAGRPGSGARRHDSRLGRRVARLERLHGADGGGRIPRRVRFAAAGPLG
jgi:hypothetical protein